MVLHMPVIAWVEVEYSNSNQLISWSNKLSTKHRTMPSQSGGLLGSRRHSQNHSSLGTRIFFLLSCDFIWHCKISQSNFDWEMSPQMDPSLYSLHKAIKHPESVHAGALYYPPHNNVRGSTQTHLAVPCTACWKNKNKTLQLHPTSCHHETGGDNRLDNSGRPPMHRTRLTRCRFGTEIHLGWHFFLHTPPCRPMIIGLAKHIPSVGIWL
jgi:hypothetical protein